MSQQGPILVVSTAGRRPSFASALDEAKLFPVVESEWSDAVRAIGIEVYAGEIATDAGLMSLEQKMRCRHAPCHQATPVPTSRDVPPIPMQ